MISTQVRLSGEESPEPGCSYQSQSAKKTVLKRRGSKGTDSTQEMSMSSAVLKMLEMEKEMREERRVWEFYLHMINIECK